MAGGIAVAWVSGLYVAYYGISWSWLLLTLLALSWIVAISLFIDRLSPRIGQWLRSRLGANDGSDLTANGEVDQTENAESR